MRLAMRSAEGSCEAHGRSPLNVVLRVKVAGGDGYRTRVASALQANAGASAILVNKLHPSSLESLDSGPVVHAHEFRIATPGLECGDGGLGHARRLGEVLLLPFEQRSGCLT